MEKAKYVRTGYGHMAHDYFIDKLRRRHKTRQKTLSRIKTVQDALKYKEKIRRAVSEAFAPFPERTALNPEVRGIIKRSSYRIEKLTFESMPGVVVTANLYIPSGKNTKHPGVIAPCGHSMAGKAEPRYQEFCQRLVQSGFAVLIYDPINQGERDQYGNCSGRLCAVIWFLIDLATGQTGNIVFWI